MPAARTRRSKGGRRRFDRMHALCLVVFLCAMAVIGRLLDLQVRHFGFYSALASGQHGIFQELVPERGTVYARDSSDPELLHPLATNRVLHIAFADTRLVDDPEEAAERLAPVFVTEQDVQEAMELLEEGDFVFEEQESDEDQDEESAGQDQERRDGTAEEPDDHEESAGERDEQPDADDVSGQDMREYLVVREELRLREILSKEDDPYEPLGKGLTDERKAAVQELSIPGVQFFPENTRYYPDGRSGGAVLGFVGFRDDMKVGQYGIEGHFEQELAGTLGYLKSERDAAGRLIALADADLEKARDGADIVLTIDRSIQDKACSELDWAVEHYEAEGGSVIVMDPWTGKVLAMCSAPDFDPNDYGKAEEAWWYNNNATYAAYEPGSVFKAITMAAAIDAGAVTPDTVYHDTGEVRIGGYTIRNSDKKAHGDRSMTHVLEESLNTGTIFAASELGNQAFRDFVRDFGFGQATGIRLDSEASGDISSLDSLKDIYTATASFGQGITVTPIQLVAAFGTLVNGGSLMKPFIVEEVRYSDGTAEVTQPKVVRQPISARTSTLISSMLVSVVEHGHGAAAGVEGYHVGGKTGTAQVASEQGGYGSEAMHTFVGFAPIDSPAFVMLTKLDKPKRADFSSASAAPLFSRIASFILSSLEVPPDAK